MKVRVTHIDGKLPNLALMKLSYWHKARGDDVVFSRLPQPELFESAYDRVYASSIFTWSKLVVQRLQAAFPQAVVGGTGVGSAITVEEAIGVSEYEHYDYSIYPNYQWSIGFTQRGCRLNCGFCVVPKKEGKPNSVNTVLDIWRGEPHPRAIVLLDNDFFGQPECTWRARLDELRNGHFMVSFNQGINIRMITPESAAAIARVDYRDDDFTVHRLYTAWDNLGQEKVFFNGLKLLNDAGIPPHHVMVYMLIGWAKGETMDQILYRYRRLKDAGCKPYPMVYNNLNKDLKRFQRWVIRRYDEVVPWNDFGRTLEKPDEVQGTLL